jgi:hypothetical protein
MKLPPILKDKRAQVAIAGAGVLGLVVLMRRKSSGANTQSGATIQPATVDSSGTDAWNAIQDVQQGWSNQLGDFSKQLKDIQDQLAKPPVTGGGVIQPYPYPFPGKPLPTPVPKPKPVAKKPVPKPSHTYTIVKGDNLTNIAKKLHVSMATLRSKNPNLFNNAHHGGNLIHPKETVKY